MKFLCALCENLGALCFTILTAKDAKQAQRTQRVVGKTTEVFYEIYLRI